MKAGCPHPADQSLKFEDSSLKYEPMRHVGARGLQSMSPQLARLIEGRVPSPGGVEPVTRAGTRSLQARGLASLSRRSHGLFSET